MEPAAGRPRVASVTLYALLTLAILSFISTLWNPGGAIQGVLFLMGWMGVRRNRAWAAYGLGVLIAVSSGVPIIRELARGQNSDAARSSMLAVGGTFSLAMVLLLFLTGWVLEQNYGRRGRAWPWLSASALLAIFFVLFDVFQMPTASMERTILAGDRIVAWKTHGSAPARGQVVVHIYPVNRKDVFVKRVVAIPGDHVRIRNKRLFVNGVAVSEPYVEHLTDYVDQYRDNFPADPDVPLYPAAQEMLTRNVVDGDVVVPAGRYFVLGDNRDSSLDSRYWGFITASEIIGVPKLIYYSVAYSDDNRLPVMNIRWNRMFRTVG